MNGFLGRFFLFLSILFSTTFCTQAQDFTVQWEGKCERVNLDSLGRDYTLSHGAVIRGEVFYYTQLSQGSSERSSYEVIGQEYEELPFAVISIPNWVKTYSQEAQTTIVQARGEYLVDILVPAFRIVNGKLLGLKRFQLIKSRTSLRSSLQTRQSTTNDYTRISHSKLRTGRWKGIHISESGVYKISYDELKKQGFYNPENLSVWGGEPFQLPYENSTPHVDDLEQIPIYWVTRGSSPASGDYALVYLDGPTWWKYNSAHDIYDYYEHDYDTSSHYFITTDFTPKEVANIRTPTPTERQDSYLGCWGYWGHNTLLRFSGREAFGLQFEFRVEQQLKTDLQACVDGSTAKCFARFAAFSPKKSAFSVMIDKERIAYTEIEPCPSDAADLAKFSQVNVTFPIQHRKLDLTFRYHRPTYSSTGWLSRVWVNARQYFPKHPSQHLFYTDKVNGARLGFSLPEYDTDIELWEVSNRFQAQRFSSLGEASVDGNNPARVILFARSRVHEVEYGDEISNQDLHGGEIPEFLIVTHENFLSQAEAIADIYRHSSLAGHPKVVVTTTQQIYNEFSSGNYDVSAIRNYSRYLYWRGGGATSPYKNILLIGKPYYRLRERRDEVNFVPNYQSENSVNSDYSFCSDDIFGLLDPNESPERGAMDIGVGRYSITSTEQADLLLRHEQAYHTASNWGPWLTNAVMLADDGDGFAYMRGTDSMATRIERDRKDLTIKRIYADAYKQDNSWSKSHYYAVNKELNRQINKGAFLFNYIGHGNPRVLGHEAFFAFEDGASWRNLRRLPILLAASCFFASADWDEHLPLGQRLLYMPQGGSIAMIAASRLTFNYSNQLFNSQLLRAIIPKTGTMQPQAQNLGEALRKAKNKTPGNENRSKYMLIGNPALPLPNYTAQAKLLRINGSTLAGLNDTVRAGMKVELDLEVKHSDGLPFTGDVHLQLLGAKRKVRTQDNDSEGGYEYLERTNTCFRGLASVKEGQASITFVVPTDMNLDYGKGQVTMLAVSEDALAAGGYDDFIVGGHTNTKNDDTKGPDIEVSWNDYAKRPNAKISTNALLLVRLKDESGINISGAGLGHDLVAKLRRAEGEEERIVLNDFYVADKDTYQSGEVRYHFTNLTPGHYTMNIEAYDVYNNRSNTRLTFEVGTPKKAEISNLLNYPNPFTSTTSFYLDATRPGQAVQVQIQIFTPDGLLVRNLQFMEANPAYRLGPYFWDGKDEYGRVIGRGVYFYRVRLLYKGNWLEEKDTTEKFEKLLKL